MAWSYSIFRQYELMDKGMSKNWWDRNARSAESRGFKIEKKSKQKTQKNTNEGSMEPMIEVYRYFGKEEHAESFARGEIFVSTLNICRGYENSLQGDHEEGFERYNTGRTITGNGSDPAFAAMAARAGIYVMPGAEITIANNQSVRRLHNAYVLCTTLEPFDGEELEAFGKYCVKINDVARFHDELTKSMALTLNINKTARGEIVYKDRSYKEFEGSPGLIGFVKPPDKYSDQKEYRFLWYVPGGTEIIGEVIRCPEIARLVTRLA